jgi:RimJ/RimL family protein N-acetyltransferase
MLRAPDLERDLEYIVRYAADAEAMRFIGTGETHGSEQAREWLDGYLRDWGRIGYGRWTVTLADTREPIGNCGFILWREGEADERPELAYGYLRDAWGRGYATEAAAAVLQWTFTTLPVNEVVALTHPGNAASQRVLAKLGFESAGEVAPSHGRTMAMFVATRPTTRRDPPRPLAEGPG